MKLSGRKGQLMVLTPWSLGDFAFGFVARQHMWQEHMVEYFHGGWEAKRTEEGGARVPKSPSWAHLSLRYQILSH